MRTAALVMLVGTTVGFGVQSNFSVYNAYNAAIGGSVPSPFSTIASMGPSARSGQPGLSLTGPMSDGSPIARVLLEEVDTSPVKQARIMRGDTLAGVLIKAGVELADAHSAITALSEHLNVRRLKEGQEIELTFGHDDPASDEQTLQAIRLQSEVESAVRVARQNDGSFVSAIEAIRLDTHATRAAGEIHESLYAAMRKAGVPHNVIAEFIRIYSWDVDFQREVQPGDSFEIYFDRYENGKGRMVKTGPLLYAGLNLSGKAHNLYLYTTRDDGNADYYDENGQSVRKALLKTPIDGARLTSGFGRRTHPILGYTKMHKGLDFGAARGTPIHAAGDGTVEVAGPKGSYGNYVRIRHNGTYATAYAHMNGFGKGIRAGARVRQGDVIGYVGTTGRSTGPHLHYEVLKEARQVDPRGIKMPSGRQLAGNELASFRTSLEQVKSQIAALPVMRQLVANAE
ncbi:peptidoglycan DD-metalloendopeptidase family protein [Emcibacter sp. SYSU 3D8]|uniref:M23 family metallopeptidase n=1 Tax=Emcibacter sp. SYSU 3D8 TaxID=3133969 RepID=UPI0031FEA773